MTNAVGSDGQKSARKTEGDQTHNGQMRLMVIRRVAVVEPEVRCAQRLTWKCWRMEWAPLTMEDVFGQKSDQEQGGHSGRGEEDGGLGQEQATAEEGGSRRRYQHHEE